MGEKAPRLHGRGRADRVVAVVAVSNVGLNRTHQPPRGCWRVNSADDERNPPELGVLDAAMKRIKNGCPLVIPGSPDTAGHGAAARAKVWAQTFAEFLAKARRLSAPSATNLEQPFIWLARTPTKILWD